MRQALRLLGNRYGAALGLVVLIALVIGAGRLTGGSGPAKPNYGAAVAPTPSVSPLPDDGLDSQPPIPSPSTSPGAAAPATVATDFTEAWARHTGVTAQQWRLGVDAYATTGLAAEFANTDPADVPANAIAGQLTVIDQASSYVNVTVPMDTGTLSLRLLATDGVWLVDGVDWQGN